MTVRVRFAPSPTGHIHVGNIFVALHNWLFARKEAGEFLLRFDDTDLQRSTAEFADEIRKDLTWVGLGWDRQESQSQRIAVYDEAVARLKRSVRLYPCYETAEELALKRQAQLQSGRAPIYDRAALALTPADRAKLESPGRLPHWRFRLELKEVRWIDMVRGPQHIDEASQSDPVLIREDGTYLYTLPSVVDDIDLGVTHVIRGADHVTNTGAQIQIFEALGGPVPRFGHLPLLKGKGDEELSKRIGSLSIGELRAAGIEPLALASYLARLGTGDPMKPVHSWDELIPEHNLGKLGSASPHFDRDELAQINARLLHETEFKEVAARLSAKGVDELLWNAVRGNLGKLADAEQWATICHGEILTRADDVDLAKIAAAELPPEPWTEETWKNWTGAVTSATGKKGKALFQPLRQALTGLDHGPEMRLLLPLIGRARASARLLRGKG
jgi:glutamyl-tRNA synthetase